MPKLRVHNLSTSLDGYAAGPNQSVDDPLGVGGSGLHRRFRPTQKCRPGSRFGRGYRELL